MIMHTPSRFLHDRSASVAAAFALAIVPALYLTGVAIDYGKAARLQEQLPGQELMSVDVTPTDPGSETLIDFTSQKGVRGS